MRKIGYIKVNHGSYGIKDEVYEYIIHPTLNDIGVINPVLKDGYGAWEASKNDIDLGYKKDETGVWVDSEDCEILNSLALEIMFAFE